MTDAVRRIRRQWPRGLVVFAALGAAIIAIPLLALLVRVPWSGLVDAATSEVVRDALLISLVTSLAAAVVSIVLGVPLAWVLARTDAPGRGVLRALVTLPMILPPVVGGAALLFAFGRRGVLGEWLEQSTGLVLPFSIWGVILANTFVALPFLVITVEGGLVAAGTRREEAAATLGATPWHVFRRVTLPSVAPAIRAGAILAWARAFGEFGATITFAGNLPGRTQTLPLAVFVSLDADRDAAIAISLIMVVVSFVILLTLRDRWWSGSAR